MIFDVRVHTQLQELNDLEIGWAAQFVPDSVAGSLLAQLSCIEIRVDELNHDDQRFDAAAHAINDLISRVVKSMMPARSYLLKTNGSISSRTRAIDPLGLMELPPNPGGLGPEWTRDPRHVDPNDPGKMRFKDPSGRPLDWHPGQPGKRGWSGKDHWHDPNNFGKRHLLTPPSVQEIGEQISRAVALAGRV